MPASVESKDNTGILEGWKPAEKYDPPHKEIELVGQLRQRFDEGYQHRIAWDRQWELNRLYLKGQQLLIRNRSTNEVFRLPQNDSNRLISVNNILRPTARSLLGKLTRIVPTCAVVPASDDISDMQGALVGDALIQYQRRKEHLDIVYIDVNRDIVSAGTGIIKLSWDKDRGETVAFCPDCGYKSDSESEVGEECPQCVLEVEFATKAQTQLLGGFGEEEIPSEADVRVSKLKGTKEGDTRVEVIDFRDFFLDPGATKLSEAQWVCHRVPLPINVIRQSFKKGKYVEAESGLYTDRHVGIIQDVINTSQQIRYLENHVYLYEFHERPTEDHPEGRVIFMSGGIILEEMDSPYYKLFGGRFPFFAFFFEQNKGEFWGESFIEQAWTQQRELNILLTQMREHRDLTNRPKLFVPMTAKIGINEIDTTAGQIIHYNAVGGKPHYGELPAFPSYVFHEVNRLKEDIRTHASVTEQEAGATGSRVSGRYAAIVEAESSQQVGPILKSNNHEWCEIHRCILLLCQEFYSSDRKWTIQGFDRPKTFYFDELNMQPGYDIVIEEEDSLSQNSAVRLEQNINLARLGLFNDPKTGQFNTKAFAKSARLKLPFIGPDADGSERATAAAVPNQIENGMDYEPKPWDDVTVFAEELIGWLRGPGRNASQQTVQKVFQLWQTYMELVQQQQGQAPGFVPQGANAPQNSPQQAGASQVLPEAEQMTQTMDQQAEAMARSQSPHES